MPRCFRAPTLAVSAVFLSLSAVSGQNRSATVEDEGSAVQIGISMGEVDSRAGQAKALVAWVHGLPKTSREYRADPRRATRARTDIPILLSFNIGMPPTATAIQLDCGDVKRAYDLNPNDLSVRGLWVTDWSNVTVQFGLPDLRGFRALLSEAEIDCF